MNLATNLNLESQIIIAPLSTITTPVYVVKGMYSSSAVPKNYGRKMN